MHSFSDVISMVCPAEYVPPLYLYHNLSFDELPAAARQVLVDYGVIQSNLDSFSFKAIDRIWTSHLVDFGDCLQDIQTKFVVNRRAAADITRSFDISKDVNNVDDKKLWDLSRIVYELETSIIPEWYSHLDRYVHESDALVWLRARRCSEKEPPTLLEERSCNIREGIRILTVWLDNIHDQVVKREKERRFLMTGGMEDEGLENLDMEDDGLEVFESHFSDGTNHIGDVCADLMRDQARYMASLPSPPPWMTGRERGRSGN